MIPVFELPWKNILKTLEIIGLFILGVLLIWTIIVPIVCFEYGKQIMEEF